MSDTTSIPGGIVDFGVFPPTGSFLKGHMFAQPVRAEKFSTSAGMTPAATLYSHDLDAFLAEMAGAGIATGVVRGWKTAGGRTGTFGKTPMAAVDVHVDEVRAFVQQHPDSFVGFAALGEDDALGDPAAVIAEIDGKEIRGITLSPGGWSTPTYANDRDRLFSVYDLCSQAGAPVLLDFGGNSGPDISFSSPIVLDDVAKNFPDLKLVVSHAGWPWVTEALHIAFRRGNVFLSPDMYIFGYPGWHDYVEAGNTFLQDNIVFSSAYPFLPQPEAARRFAELFTPGAVEKVMSLNAKRLLGLD